MEFGSALGTESKVLEANGMQRPYATDDYILYFVLVIDICGRNPAILVFSEKEEND